MHHTRDGNRGLEIRLFGAFRCRLHGQALQGLRSRKGEALLALLALRNNADLPRSWVADVLWPESSYDRRQFYLRRELSNLRSALREEAWRIQSPTRDTVRFDPTDAEIDVFEFDQACLTGSPESMGRAVALYDGSLLEAMDWDWAVVERTRREHAFMDLLSDLATRALQAGRHADAVPLLRRAISVEPLRESLHRSLFEALAELEDYGALAKAYRSLRHLLTRELGVDPSHETQELVRRIRTRAQDLAETSEEAPTEPASSSDLPGVAAKMFGRDEDQREVVQLFRKFRGVVLTGSGGVGKTSLSILAARDMLPEMRDGVQFVSLATTLDEAAVPTAVLNALGIGLRSGSDPTDALSNHYRARQALLVLDNCEQVSHGVEALMDRLLQACSSLRILASSRHSLRADGVLNWRVPSLGVPTGLDLMSASPDVLDAIRRCPSVKCFLQRASQFGASIKLSPPNAKTVAAICLRLDGIPLAIELAAARAPSVPLGQLEAKLADRFRLLSRGGKQAVPRQATLRAAIDWSVRLLEPAERELFVRLAVFTGGWTLEAAEDVCSTVPLERDSMAGHLSSLVEKSLVVFDPEVGEGRYRLLETLREYALEELSASPELESLKGRHLAYYYHLAADYAPLLYERDSVIAQRVLHGEMDNLEAAQDHCMQLPALSEPLPGLTAARASLQFVRMLQRLNFVQGDLEKSRVRALNVIQRAVPHVGGSELAWAYVSAAVCASFRGLVREATDLLKKALELGRACKDDKVVARALQNKGWALFRLGQYQEARECFFEALDVLGEDGEPMWRGLNLHYLADTDLAVGAYLEAESHARQALLACEGTGCSLVEGYVLMNVGITEMAFGRLKSARDNLWRSIETHRKLGDRFHRGKAQLWLARLALQEGKSAESQKTLAETTQMLFDIGSELEIVQCLEFGAELAMTLERPHEASALLSVAARQREALGTPESPVEAGRIEEVRSRLQSDQSANGTRPVPSTEAPSKLSDAVAIIQDLCRVPA